MIRKGYIIGILALGLAATAVRTSPWYGRLQSSAQSFERHFHDLQEAGNTLSPFERIVFSLILANSTAPASGHQVAAPAHHS